MAKSTGSKIWRVLVGILVVILILLVVAELGLRWFIGDQLRSTFEADAQEQGITLEEDPSISFGTTPLVFSVLGRNIPQLEMTTPSTLQIDYPDGPNSIPEVNGSPSATVAITDLDIADPNNPVAGTMNTTTEIPDDMILAMIQQSTAASQEGSDATDFGAAIMQELIKITDVSAQPDTNTIDVEFTGGAAVLSVEPRVENGELRFQATGASLFGFDLPEQVTGMITAALEEGMQDATGDMEITEFTVIDGGIRVSIRGENLPLSELGAVTTGATGQAEVTP
ncbi:LmeA family phospholipid-binding protein [Corynebacterium sp. A21]|uniref:LmeA family phospholipid-binding protein n=1 Tax=Corynebacterium sp. A21 TaxID=3457318 RepID=UPI003FD647A4